MSFDYLAPKIRQILSAPDTDWSTISAKHVRRQLLELEPNLTPEYMKENKKAIGSLISSIFESMHNSEPDHEAEPALNGNGKRMRQHDNGGEGVDQGQNLDGEDERDPEEGSPSPAARAPKKRKKGKASGLTDEEYARQLSSELNQRPARAGRKANGTAKKGAAASKSSKKVKKSREQIEDDSEADGDADDDQGGSRKGKKGKSSKKGSGGGAKGGFAKEFALSDPLAAVLEVPQLSRPQVVKKLWQYIRLHDLQNPKNKKEIICDDALRAVFNSDKIDMFGMNKTLGQHLYELES